MEQVNKYSLFSSFSAISATYNFNPFKKQFLLSPAVSSSSFWQVSILQEAEAELGRIYVELIQNSRT